jgi:hypothetical protein
LKICIASSNGWISINNLFKEGIFRILNFKMRLRISKFELRVSPTSMPLVAALPTCNPKGLGSNRKIFLMCKRLRSDILNLYKRSKFIYRNPEREALKWVSSKILFFNSTLACTYCRIKFRNSQIWPLSEIFGLEDEKPVLSQMWQVKTSTDLLYVEICRTKLEVGKIVIFQFLRVYYVSTFVN